MKKKLMIAVPLLLVGVIGIGFATWAYGVSQTSDDVDNDDISISGYTLTGTVNLDYLKNYTINTFYNGTQSNPIVFKASYNGEPDAGLLYKFEITFNDALKEYLYPTSETSEDSGLAYGTWTSGVEVKHSVLWREGMVPDTNEKYDAFVALIPTFDINVRVWVEDDLAAIPATIQIATIPTSLVVGGTYNFGALVKDAYGVNLSEDIVWTSSNTNIAEFVDGGSQLTMKAKGSTAITAKVASDLNIVSAPLVVNVYNEELQSVTFSTNNITLANGSSQEISYSLYPATAYIAPAGISYVHGNSSVAEINPTTRVITAKAIGSTYIKIQIPTENIAGTIITREDTVNITVIAAVSTGISITGSSNDLNVGSTLPLSITATPVGSETGTIIWSSSNTSRATVSTSGVVTGVSAGAVTITAKMASNQSVTATYSITVLSAVDKTTIYGGYYKNIQTGATGSTLVSQLKTLLNTSKSVSYDWERYEWADEDLNDTNSIFCVYARETYLKTAHVSGSSGWNREHSFPDSKVKSYSGAASDNHHIFACDNVLNNSRGSKLFGTVSGTDYVKDSLNRTAHKCKSGTYFEPGDEAKGEVARATFYMCVVYTGLSITGNFTSTALALNWHTSNLPTAREEQRNDHVQDLQKNRNPFIDFPEWAAMCFDSSYSGPGAFE